MPEDKPNFTPDDDEQPKISPSALFLEMMREAARHAEKPQPPVEEPVPYTDSASETFSASESDVVTEQSQNEVPAAESLATEASVESADIPSETSIPEADSVTSEASEETPAKPEVGDSRVPIYTPPRTEDTISPEDRATLLEAQRIRRVRRREERTHERRVGIVGGFVRTLFIAIFSAALASTVFTWFTTPEFITQKVANDLQVAEARNAAVSTPIEPTEIRVTPNFMQQIGIVAGHRGPENDPGAVCDDGLTELEINFSVAQIIVRELRVRGFTVDLLDEFDPRLEGYQGSALVSLHSNDCRDYGEYVSGFLVARAAARPPGGFDDVLAECIGLHYGRLTGIERRYTLTLDMTDYHTFREIHPLTPAAILEMGFMRADRDLLTNRQDMIAEAVIEGIICYLNGENPIPQLTATPAPLPTATDGG